MSERTKNFLIQWWNSRQITTKFGVIILMLLFIGLFQSIMAISAFNIIDQSILSAETSLEVQRLTLEMSRDWESMKISQYRFFAEYQQIGYMQAKERYALPAGEKISDIIRTGAALRRMSSAPDASDNLKTYDDSIRGFLYTLGIYTEELNAAVMLAFDPTATNTELIQIKRETLEEMGLSIEPNFTSFVLMAQNEVIHAKNQVIKTQNNVTLLLIITNLIGIFLAGIILTVFRKTLAFGVRQLTHASQKMQNGELDVRVNLDSKDEFGEIGTAFDRMAAAIQERTIALREYEHRYQALFNQSNDAVFLVELSGKILNANQKALVMHGYNFTQLKHLMFQDLITPEGKDTFSHILELSHTQDTLPVIEFWLTKKDAEPFPVEINLTRVLDDHDQPKYLQLIARDISERKAVEENLRTMALYDSLTGLPNRTHLYTRLTDAIQAAKNENHLVAVLYLDIDGFKNINDTFGHQQGDQFLIEIGEKLKSTIRSSDLVARVGGDEFIIFLNHILDPQSAQQVAEKIIDKLAEPTEIDGQPVVITTSLGISLYPQNGEEVELLIKKADQAMYQIKNKMKNGYQFSG